MFISPEGRIHTWFQNFYLTQNDLQKLINYLDSRQGLTVCGISKECKVGSKELKISTFDIYKKPADTSNYILTESPDIFYLMKEIRKFQNNEK
jgi:hypothetical protein